MVKFIELHTGISDGGELLDEVIVNINPEKIMTMTVFKEEEFFAEESENKVFEYTRVTFDNSNSLTVKETPQEIKYLIKDLYQ